MKISGKQGARLQKMFVGIEELAGSQARQRIRRRAAGLGRAKPAGTSRAQQSCCR
jgi:hypothetical protein